MKRSHHICPYTDIAHDVRWGGGGLMRLCPFFLQIDMSQKYANGVYDEYMLRLFGCYKRSKCADQVCSTLNMFHLCLLQARFYFEYIPSMHTSVSCILIYTEGKSFTIYFWDSKFRRNRTFNFIVSKIYVDKLSRVRLH